MKRSEYEALALVASGRSTLDHIVQAFDIHSPQAYRLLAVLEEQGLIRRMSDWGAAGLRYGTTPQGERVLGNPGPEGARGVETLEQDESATLESIGRTGRPPKEADLSWNVSTTVQYLWEVGKIDVHGMVRPRLAVAAR